MPRIREHHPRLLRRLTLLVLTTLVAVVFSARGAPAAGPVPFAGTYLGRFNGNPGDRFALVVRPDGTARFVGYAMSLFTGYSAPRFAVAPDGTFAIGLTELLPGAVTTPAGDTVSDAIEPPLPAAAPLVLRGTFTAGVFTGSIAEAGLSLEALQSPADGPARNLAGLYETAALNRSHGKLTSIVDAAGKALVVAHTSLGVAVGIGSIDLPTGQIAVTLDDGSFATTLIDPATNSARATLAAPARETLTFAGLVESATRTGRIDQLVTCGAVTVSDPLVFGFVISGPSPKSVMIRATGPALAAFGLGGTLPNPKLELYRGMAKIQENDDWSAAANATEVIATVARTGAFPLTAASADAVLLTTLAPGGYTAQVSSVTAAAGVALVEVYDAGSTAVTADTPRLINIFTRANVAGGEGLMIAGIVITGNSPKKILIRATGPALAAFGVSGALTDPLLKLYQGDAVLRQNDNWSDSATEAALIAAAGSATGAFALTPGTKDAALLITLEPGAYTAQVSGVAGAAGAALVEVYEVP